jgi:hypothetical protein
MTTTAAHVAAVSEGFCPLTAEPSRRGHGHGRLHDQDGRPGYCAPCAGWYELTDEPSDGYVWWMDLSATEPAPAEEVP